MATVGANNGKVAVSSGNGDTGGIPAGTFHGATGGNNYLAFVSLGQIRSHA